MTDQTPPLRAKTVDISVRSTNSHRSARSQTENSVQLSYEATRTKDRRLSTTTLHQSTLHRHMRAQVEEEVKGLGLESREQSILSQKRNSFHTLDEFRTLTDEQPAAQKRTEQKITAPTLRAATTTTATSHKIYKRGSSMSDFSDKNKRGSSLSEFSPFNSEHSSPLTFEQPLVHSKLARSATGGASTSATSKVASSKLTLSSESRSNADWVANIAEIKRLEHNLVYAGTLAQHRPEDADLTPKLCDEHLSKIVQQFDKGKEEADTIQGFTRKKSCQDYVRIIVYGHVPLPPLDCNQRTCCSLGTSLDNEEETTEKESEMNPKKQNAECVPFDMFVLAMIVLNAVLIVTYQVLENETTVDIDSTFQLLHVLEFVFMGIFTVECILRFVALKCKRYFLEAWNVLDLTIVITGWVALAYARTDNVTSLRLLRLARILRTTRYFRGVLILLDVLRNNFRILLITTFVVAFNLLIFASVGMQLFGPALRRRCAVASFAAADLGVGTGEYVAVGRWCNAACARDGRKHHNRQAIRQNASAFSSASWLECDATRPYFGGGGHQCGGRSIVAADGASTTGNAWSQENATCVMTDGSDVFLVGNSTNSGPLSFLGFEKFSQALATMLYISVGDAVVLVRDRLGDSTSFTLSSLFVYVVLCSTAVPYAIMLTGLICSGLNTKRDTLFQTEKKRALKLSSLKNKEKKCRGGRKHKKKKTKHTTSKHQKQQQKQQFDYPAQTQVEMLEMNNVEAKSTTEVEVEAEKEEGEVGEVGEVAVVESTEQIEIELSNASVHQDISDGESSDESNSETDDESDDEVINIEASNENQTNKGNWLTPIVTSRNYELTIMVLILTNTVFLTYEAFAGGNEDDFSEWIVWVEAVFSIIFLLEMISKMWGLTIYGYFSNKWNIMDFIIVVLAVVVTVLEIQYLMISSDDDVEGEEESVDLSGIVSARAMRLFRISRVTRVAKAASFFGALRRESFAVSFYFQPNSNN